MIDGAWTMWGEEGRARACADRHDRPGPAPVGGGIRPSTAGCRGRGLPPAPARRQAGAHVHGKNHGVPAGHDLSAGRLCQRAHPERQHEPGKGAELLRMLRAPLGIFAVQGNHDQYYGWESRKNMLADLGICAMWNDSFLLHLPGGRKLQLSSVRDDFHMGGQSRRNSRCASPRPSPTFSSPMCRTSSPC